MQSQPTDPLDLRRANRQFTADALLPNLPDLSHSNHEDTSHPLTEPTQFHSRFVDSMEMYADPQTVAHYLDTHQGWFGRCAHPMHAESLGNNSYALIIGRFGAFGYEVEPKIGLNLLPQQDGIYRIETVPVPNYITTGYDVDFRAALELVEGASRKGEKLTQVQWQLDLTVRIQFPKFIHALPDPLIQKTGDRILRQVVRQVSRRLTHKVQEDFHSSRSLLLPKRSKKWL
jgi:Protein of unknown function (DUF1997)